MYKDHASKTQVPGGHPPKNIVICCDGTGNEFGNENSNVVKLYSTLVIDSEQMGYYHPGVGTMGAPTARGRMERTWSRIKGLAFGSGLLDNVADAYRYLMDVYAEGDRIYIFGFSRGAYTARVLGGVLRMFGLLCPGNEGHIPYVMRMYAARRRQAGRQEKSVDVDEVFKYIFSRDVELHFVGVWDTVSSVGWVYDPVKLPFTGNNPIIRNGRQAVSIHERRCFYLPMLWGTPERNQDMKQVWFSGVHSDVGGSYPELESQLSKFSLEWMLKEATAAGLKVNPEKALCVLGRGPKVGPLPDYVPPDAAGKIHGSLRGAWWLLELLPHKYEKFPGTGSRLRWRIPLGAYRRIPEGAVIYEPALAAIDAKQLPKRYNREARVPFASGQSLPATA